MPIGVLTRIEIFDASLYKPGGMVNRWVHDLGKHFGEYSRAAIKSRSGVLKKGVRVTYRNRGSKRIQATIGSTAPHTMAVLHGTAGGRDSGARIMSNAAFAAGGPKFEMIDGRPVPRKGHVMAVGKNLWGPITPKALVRGQNANNFFYKGWVVTARRHRSLGKVPFPEHLR